MRAWAWVNTGCTDKSSAWLRHNCTWRRVQLSATFMYLIKEAAQ